MKKIFSILAAALVIFAAMSCNPGQGSNPSFGIVYNVTALGDADGIVNVTLPNGVVGLNGDADLNIIVSNDTLSLKPVYGLDEASISNEEEVVAAASRVDDWFTTVFNVNAVEGTYYVHITGYVRETLTGFIFAIDREFTNRPKDE